MRRDSVSQPLPTLETVEALQQRIEQLEGMQRWATDAFEIVASLGDFQASINSGHDLAAMFSETCPRIKQVVNFKAMAFMTVNEEDAEFVINKCEPGSMQTYLQDEVDYQIDQGTFAWALGQARAVLAQTSDRNYTLVLHTLATRARVRGMFVGLTDEKMDDIQGASLNLLSVILLNVSNVLESHELYNYVNEQNRNLEEIVKRRTEQLENAIEEAESANRAKSTFLATMSHEIRTPLNGVLGMLGLLQKEEMAPSHSNKVGVAYRSAETLLALLNDILDLSKIDAEKLELEESDFDLKSLAEEVVALFLVPAQDKGLELLCMYNEDVPRWVCGDPTRIRQVLSNLIGNAIKFTKEDGVALRVSCMEQGEDSVKLEFKVCDTGIGIDEETQGRIFQPFSQADESTTRNFGGTGLGLNICKKLVERMGGEIGVDSTPGVGSTFWCALTLATATAPASVAIQGSTATGLVANPGDYHILVVEDNEVNQAVVLGFLEKTGFQATAVANGEEALESVRSNEFALIFMDCHMPVMDGYEATKQIRAREQEGDRIPVIALTADATPENIRICMDTGMDDYLSKPFRPEQFEAMLQHWFPDTSTEAAQQQEHVAEEVQYLAVDFAVIDQLRGSIGDVIESIIESFLTNTRERIEGMKRAIIKDELDALFLEAHSLKSSSALLGALSLSELCGTLEGRTKNGIFTGVSQSIVQIEEEFARVCGALAARGYKLV
jgi:signal transduction histidine kinase/DNA-binding response OmpR family regulator